MLKAAFACVLLCGMALEAPSGAAVARAGMQDWTCFPLFIPDDLWMTLRGQQRHLVKAEAETPKRTHASVGGMHGDWMRR